MIKEGPDQVIPETESQNWSEMAKAKIREADDRYNSLFRSIEIGGEPVTLPTIREFQAQNMELSEALIELLPQYEKLASAMKETMGVIGLTVEEAEHFKELRQKTNSLGKDEYNEIVEYINKVEQFFQSLLEKGFTEEEIIQYEFN